MNLKSKLPEDKAFYVQNGPVIKSLQELAEALENDSISDDAFRFHLGNTTMTLSIGSMAYMAIRLW